MSKDSEIIGIEEVAEMMGVSVRTVQRHINRSKGDFPGKQIGGKWVFHRSQVVEWVRGEWLPPEAAISQKELIEKEVRRWGADMPETLVDLQQEAKREKSGE